jgi:hypothetical protein
MPDQAAAGEVVFGRLPARDLTPIGCFPQRVEGLR